MRAGFVACVCGLLAMAPLGATRCPTTAQSCKRTCPGPWTVQGLRPPFRWVARQMCGATHSRSAGLRPARACRHAVECVRHSPQSWRSTGCVGARRHCCCGVPGVGAACRGHVLAAIGVAGRLAMAAWLGQTAVRVYKGSGGGMALVSSSRGMVQSGGASLLTRRTTMLDSSCVLLRGTAIIWTLGAGHSSAVTT